MTKRNAHDSAGNDLTGMAVRRILVPIDFSIHSRNALEYSIQIAKKFNSELILLYVVESTVYPHDFGLGRFGMVELERELTKKGNKELEKLLKTVLHESVPGMAMVRHGKPYVEIIAAAKKENIDLIVIATRGHTEVEQLLFGGTAEKVIGKAPCPVLIWRGKSSE